MVNTLQLDYIINDYGENIFDFNYVFPNITYDEIPVTKETLEQGFIDYFLYYQIGFSTIEEFKWRLKRKWHENIRSLIKQLQIDLNLNYNVNQESENISQVISGSKSIDTTDKTITASDNVQSRVQNNDNRFSDTPNQDLGTIEQPKFLTERTLDNLTTNIDNRFTETQNKDKTNNEQQNSTKSINRTRSFNEVEKFSKISDKIKNVIYEFYKKFNCLFITDVILERGILYV